MKYFLIIFLYTIIHLNLYSQGLSGKENKTATEGNSQPFDTPSIEKKSLIIYPSDPKHWLYVQCEKELIESVELLDDSGRLKITPLPERLSQDLVAIDVRSLSKGTYFLLVHFRDGASTRKLTIGDKE